MRKKIIYFVFLLCSFTVSSQSILGKWASVHENTRNIESVIEIYEEGDIIFGKIIAISDPSRKNALCNLCEGNLKDQPILGMVIVRDLKQDKDEWSGGRVLDPKNGKEYKCTISLKDENTMKLRGYIGFSVFGRTAYWYRVNDKK
jgi:uncharacterized protein (DUF2147 family)|uniref:DUF2147 domain-containing protein n=1 Tax=Polaribacter sp. TaxID=1920175 RepID=UPI00404757EE